MNYKRSSASSFLAEARHVSKINDEYRAGLLADIGAGPEEDEEVKLKHQQDELEKTMTEYNARLDEVRKAVQSNLWPRYGEDEVSSAILEAGRACERAQAIPMVAINRDGYKLQL